MLGTILTAAITGSGTSPRQTPYLPITPEQIANSALEAADAGAAIVHLHVRNPDNGDPSMDLELYADVVERIKKYNQDLLINLTCGPGATGDSSSVFGEHDSRFKTAQERTRHIVALKPDLCSLDFNTMNRGPKNITVNSIKIVKEMATIIKQTGVKPELEIFDSGDLRIAKQLIDQNFIDGIPFIQLATGIRWGWDSSIDTLEYAKKLLPETCVWSAFGIGEMEMPYVALSSMSGGHVRVGLEDNIYLSKGILAKSNAELVGKAKRIIQDLGGELASATQAREILKI